MPRLEKGRKRLDFPPHKLQCPGTLKPLCELRLALAWGQREKERGSKDHRLTTAVGRLERKMDGETYLN